MFRSSIAARFPAPPDALAIRRPATRMTAYRARIRFRKDGDRRFLSHHDLMRLFERLLRRAGLPFRMTDGFHPMPRMQFASALSLGIIGHEEVLEVDFTEELDSDGLQALLSAHVPEGITILNVRAVPAKGTVQPVEAHYFFSLPGDCCPDLQNRLNAMLMQDQVWSERLRPGELRRASQEPESEERLDQLPHTVTGSTGPVKRVDIRPFLLQLTRTEHGLQMAFKVTPNGSARPEEVLRLLGLDSLLHSGTSVIERTHLKLNDETTAEDCDPRKMVMDQFAPTVPVGVDGADHSTGSAPGFPNSRGVQPTSS